MGAVRYNEEKRIPSSIVKGDENIHAEKKDLQHNGGCAAASIDRLIDPILLGGLARGKPEISKTVLGKVQFEEKYLTG